MIGPILPGKQKWYGGILGEDGCIYAMPMCAKQVLKIDPSTQEVKLIGRDLSSKGWKWHGGCASNGKKDYLKKINEISKLSIILFFDEIHP